MSSGFKTFQDGTVADQTRLLRLFINGLEVYNKQPDSIIDTYCERVRSEQVSVSQAPMQFRRRARGGKQYAEQVQYRDLILPLDSYDVEAPFELEFLQDAREEQITDRMNAAMAGDAELMKSLFFSACMTKKTAGAIGTAYQPSFWNGETDVPPYGEYTFGSAHYQYAGINTTTLARDHILTGVVNIREHGFGENPGEIDVWFSPSQTAAVEGLFDTASTILQAATPMRQRAIDMGVQGANLMMFGANVKFDAAIPAGYFLLLVNTVKPVGVREHRNPDFQGLQLFGEQDNPDFPLLSKYFLRRVGFAPLRLGAGAAYQIVASTTYTNPTFRLL